MTRRSVVAVTAAVAVAMAACSGGGDDGGQVPQPTMPADISSLSEVPEPPASARGTGFDSQHVTLRLTRVADSPGTISFGLPLPPGAVTDPATISVTANGAPAPATVSTLLSGHDAAGAVNGIRSVLIQLPGAVMTGDELDVDVAFTGGQSGPPALAVPFERTSVISAEQVRTAERTIEEIDGRATLVTTDENVVTLFTGREPAVQALYPPGYLAATGILGPQVTTSDPVAGALGGLEFVSEQITPFGMSASYREDYPLNPADDSVVIPDPAENYEAWLYDRCATFLSFYVHTDDPFFLRESYRDCSYYAGQIGLSGESRGIFAGKAEPDVKYSHLRGLYAYYALTGDETAREAGEAIADLWLNDTDFVGPYADGHIESPDALWTERLLGVSLEGLVFGFLLTDDRRYLTTFQDVLDTAYLHITGDAAALSSINPGTPGFPPQNCFIHTASQHAEGDSDEPWCSGWMSELLLPGLLEYQAMTGDARVDDIFVRLTRFMRDVGTSYFVDEVLDDTFLAPREAFDPAADPDERRLLVPLYGAGLDTDGDRQQFGEYDDTQHCLDGSALAAAGLRGLRRLGIFDANPVGPFPSEGASFLALEHELLYCARWVFGDQTRPNRDPATWTSEELAEGLSDPEAFILDNKIGYPVHNNSPERRLSWWFNSALLDYGLLVDAKVEIAELRPGQVQP
ncbi:hypothetical protein I6A84_19400 [Frankia sp. CNm7]|uniref:Lipoprotein n=1 Tax=Frankia nepalensis TaxID=1836974 RepID=A0A937UV66_9ACTN|nr:hypothetical protein [Frankia nepalensis]MBL7494944.1 hypothetical protein [Frankia nepalensis]MBL7515995.1 hypothetical protein [Frankia nepalensis]MBL7520197.1 hypothetical protein [Frankia nepalensis]MBL7632955.1 hypothetical protein [Frankia nepalensis]